MKLFCHISDLHIFFIAENNGGVEDACSLKSSNVLLVLKFVIM